MIRGVAELFRVLFPALDDFPGNLEDSALALILGSEHPEGFIRLNLTAAEAGDFVCAIAMNDCNANAMGTVKRVDYYKKEAK